jgi:hypothetical protein
MHAPPFGLQLSTVQPTSSSHVFGSPGVQPASAAQASPTVQSFPSLHAWPTFAVKVHPVAGLQPSVVQPLPSLHGTCEPTQLPAVQWSPLVQRLLSEQVLVLSTTKAQPPSAGMQLSSVQGLLSEQTFAVPGTQMPLPLHVSAPLVPVQPFPSEHGAPLAGVKTQAPVWGLQLSVVQALLSEQGLSAPFTHAPWKQVSTPLVPVQASPSEQVLVSSLV